MIRFRGDSVSRPIVVIALVLAVFGMVAVLSASAGKCTAAPEYDYNSLYFFERQCFWFIGSVVAMCLVRKHLDLDKQRHWYGFPLLLLATLLAFCVLFTTPVNGARRWLSLGPIRFQVGEFAKLALIFYWADFLSRHRKRVSEEKVVYVPPLFDWRQQEPPKPWWEAKVTKLWNDFLPLIPPFAITSLLIVFIEIGKDLGTIVVMGMTLLTTMWAAGVRRNVIYSVIGSGFMLGVLMVLKEPYRLSRIMSWRAPLEDSLGVGYQVSNSLVAISTGGWWGVGIPFSMQKYDFLPEQHCDFIYAIICEELGFVGSFGLLLLYVALAYCGFALAVRCKDAFSSLLCFGITSQLVLQTLFNVGVVTGMLPNKGLPLPFISYGGSSLLCSFVAVGVLLNIADGLRGKQSKDRHKEKKKKVRKASSLSSSEQSIVQPVSSGEWEAVVAIPISQRPKEKLPKPIVEPVWGAVVPFEPGKRYLRERIRRRQAR